jgi:hypothetical protein
MNEYGIYKWNYLRNTCRLSSSHLETEMFEEEYLEWQSAMAELIELGIFGQKALTHLVDIIDAFCDMEFVLLGSKAKGDFDARKDRILEYVYNTTIATLQTGFIRNPSSIINEARGFVLEANNMKPLVNTKSKVLKGDDWVDPKHLIHELLTRCIY